MPRTPISPIFALTLAIAAVAGVANQVNAANPPSSKIGAQAGAGNSAKDGGWVAPGTPGSPIDGTVFHAQVLLDAAGFSPGVIDGRGGMSLDNAIKGFQRARGLKESGELDYATRKALLEQERPSTVMVTLNPEQVAGPFVYPFPKKPEDQSKLQGMGYRNMLEKVAEAFHTTPDTIVALNGPTATIGAGRTLRLPNVKPAMQDYGAGAKDADKELMNQLNVAAGDIKGDHVVVDKSDGVLRVMDADDRLVAQFPVTMGSSHDPLPIGDWKVTTYAYSPPFHYQPDLFWDAKDKTADDKMLPPGPNGPVGVAWLDLTKEHYGIHGTPEPSTIGRAESHGCIRMTNWDVLRLSQMLKPGFKAVFQA